jgi:hypothetical protein
MLEELEEKLDAGATANAARRCRKMCMAEGGETGEKQ